MAQDEQEFEETEFNPAILIHEITQTITQLESQLDSLTALPPEELQPFTTQLESMREDLKVYRFQLKVLVDSTIIPKESKKIEPEFPNAKIESTVLDIMNLAVTFYTQNPGLAVDPSGVYNLLMYSYSAPDDWWNERYAHKVSIVIGTPERLVQYFDNIIYKLNKHKAFDKRVNPVSSGICTTCTPTQRILGYTRAAAINAIEEFRKYCYSHFGIEG